MPWIRGGPNLDFLEKCNLGKRSHPADWLNMLLPLTPCDNLESIADVNTTGDKRTKFLVANFTSYTNIKAGIANAGCGVILFGEMSRLEK